MRKSFLRVQAAVVIGLTAFFLISCASRETIQNDNWKDRQLAKSSPAVYYKCIDSDDSDHVAKLRLGGPKGDHWSEPWHSAESDMIQNKSGKENMSSFDLVSFYGVKNKVGWKIDVDATLLAGLSSGKILTHLDQGASNITKVSFDCKKYAK